MMKDECKVLRLKFVGIDDFSCPIYRDQFERVWKDVNYDAMFKGLAKKFNKCHKEPLPPVMTPHTMRHTFCTRMANAGMNPKALQYIMGHANIVMTLNYYAHATFQSAQAEMARLEAAKVETTVVVAETTVENTEETKAAA